MSTEFRPAVRDKTSVIVALAGASGSGKTYTAILMALGLAYPGMAPGEILAALAAEGKSRIAFIDTEGGRGLHYAPGKDQQPDFINTFPFEYAEIRAPYTPEAYQEAIQAADKAGFQVVILDSTSHEYESEGGIQEIADIAEQGVLKPGKTLADAESREDGWKAWAIKPVKSPGNWKDAKTRHKRFVNRAIQARAHLIFCLRAEEKMLMKREPKLDRDGQQKMWNGQPQFETKIIPAEDRPLLERWAPICEKRFMYEMTVSFLLLPSAPGVGHPIKNLQDQFRPMFPEGQRLGVENGRALAEWSHGRKLGTAAPSPRPSPPPSPAPRESTQDEPTQPPAEQTKQQKTPREWVDAFKKAIAACADMDALDILMDGRRETLERLRASDEALWKECDDAHKYRVADFMED